MPKIFGKLTYFFGYPIFRLLIKGTTRAYVVVLVEDEILVTKNWLGFQKKWRLPGGGVNAGEQPIIAAQRELLEEVGIAIHEQNLQPLSSKPFRSNFKYDYYLFTLRMPQKPKLKIDNKEILSAEFVSLKQIEKLNISEELKSFLKVAQ